MTDFFPLSGRRLAAPMFSRKIKGGVFVVEGLNSIATTFYFYYLYFFTAQHFGFSTKQNLLLAAYLGIICTLASIYGGRFAQRRGYFLALKTGFTLMGVGTFCAGLLLLGREFLFGGARIPEIAAHVFVASFTMLGMCFTWATMQALISEKEPVQRLRSLIGIYNLTWAGAGSLAYFVGGAMIQRFGLHSMFFVPAFIHGVQFWMARKLERMASSAERNTAGSRTEKETVEPTPKEEMHGSLPPVRYLHMAWLANPFAYLAINTVIAVIPSLATSLDFSPAFAGVFCSVWFFVRTGSFEILRRWPNWHYRFGWLAAAFLGMIVGFATLLLSKSLWLLLLAQVVFGLSIGLIYYSSIFYSMDVGTETKGEHGGFHEGMIGLGSFGGPAIGALALHYFPGRPESGAWAVSGLLVGGLIALLWMRFRKVSSLATA